MFMKLENAHSLDSDLLLKEAKSGMLGLDPEDAQERLESFGPNKIEEGEVKSPWHILLNQVKEVMVYILLAAALVALFLHEYIDSLVIFLILVLNTLLGFWQELKAERALSALKEMAVPEVRVRRRGREQLISAEELVPGDLVLLEAGNLVPADGRIIKSANFKVQESALTGESEAVEKYPETLDEATALADRKNMVYRATVVSYGRAEILVTQTAMDTEIGKIAGMLQSVGDERTPLQKRLDSLGKQLALLALGLIVIVAAMSLMLGESLEETFLTAVSMAVAAIPEGLPAIVTIALAIGARNMLGRNALIRNLPAVETLGSVTTICSDKTGTLTQNKMTIQSIVTGTELQDWSSEPDMLQRAVIETGILCSDAALEEKTGKVIGDPTEGSYLLAGNQASVEFGKLRADFPRVAEFPFDSERKLMSTVHEKGSKLPWTGSIAGSGDYLFCTKGAVDGLLTKSSTIVLSGKAEELSSSTRDAILAINEDLAKKGIRVLGSAAKLVGKEVTEDPSKYEDDLTFLGMVGMVDPVRPEAVEAVELCRTAGIRPVMITGDHPVTAAAIGEQLGIDSKAMRGSELDPLTEDELKKTSKQISIFARVAPEHKMKIIDALQDQHEIVAMTGDGVNDAPALKSADIGVAMGITGTDVAKESSDMVLLDDNFATIVKAVREGRRIFDNIRKFITYILTGNTGEILVMLLGPFFGMPMPLLPIQILWINLVTDGLPAIALGYEGPENDIMERPPFDPKEGIFSRGVGRRIIFTGFIVGVTSLIAGFITKQDGALLAHWRTMVFSTLTIAQMGFALTVRSESRSMFFINPFKNLALFFGVLLTMVLQLMLIYVPFFQNIFKTQALNLRDLGLCFIGAASVIALTELGKLVKFLRKKAQA
jgi:Ca2+-transporting ATPase